MTTRKQLEANRANGRKSTGPRTQAGKARSRLNSRKHGLTAEKLIIVGERAEDFDALRAELFEEFAPRSALAAEQVEHIVGLLWRRRRVPFFAAAILEARQAQVSEDAEQEEMLNLGRFRRNMDDDDMSDDEEHREALAEVGRALIKDCTSQDALGKLARHEAMLINALNKSLQLLFLLQDNRRGKDEPVILDATATRSA